MATIPLSGTNIRLLSGIPFSNDYKHTRWFDSSGEQYTWFENRPAVHTMGQTSFQRQDNQTFIRVNKSVDALYGVNYVMFQNSDYSTKWFFAFVNRLEYVRDNLTNVHIQIDLFQTWKNRIEFQPSFVVREHRPLWQADGRPVVNTVDEGLAYGLDYDTVYIEQFQPLKNIQYMVIVCKTPMHEGATSNDITPVLIGMPQPLTYYVIPFRDNDLTPTIMHGGEATVPTPPTRAMQELYKNETAVNNIVSIYITEDIGISANLDNSIPSAPAISFPNGFDTYFDVVELGGGVSTLYVKKAGKFVPKEHLIQEDKYSDYVPVRESKLLMYPYTTLVLDDFKGNRVSYKNEYINGKALSLLVKGSIGLSNFVSYGVNQYNHGNILDNPLFMDLNNESALLNNTPNDVTVINDYLTAFIQGNQNQIKNQETSIMFNGIMNGITSGASAMNAGGLASPVPGGDIPSPMGVVAGIGGVVQGAGNTVIELQGIQAKQKDIANIPPSIQKMGTNTAYNMGNNYTGVYIIKKQIKAEYRRKLTDFFNLYGYKTNEVKIPNFHTRRYWNYVETKGCVILGDFNADDLTGIKSIFDKGITLWHTDQIGNYELDNEVL